MSLTAIAHSLPGTLRQDVLVDGHHHLVTDEPQRLGGDDAGPAPHELLPAALASCISTTLVMYARTKGWELGELSVSVDYDTGANPRQFVIQITTDERLDESQLERLEKVARTCPLRRSLEAGFDFDERISSSS